MKNICLALANVFAAGIFAQLSQKINHQTVVRNRDSVIELRRYSNKCVY